MLPANADYVLSDSDQNSDNGINKAKEERIIELPKNEAYFDREEIVAPKPIDQEHTVHTSKPKKKQK